MRVSRLIDGEVIDMAPIGNPHASVVDRLTKLLVPRVGDRAIVRVRSDETVTPLAFPDLTVPLREIFG